MERGIVEDALALAGGNLAKTARLLSVPRTGLISRMATLGISRDKYKA
jgi:DNA-binding NtrC family response regulator